MNTTLEGYTDADGLLNRLPGKRQKKKLDLMVHFFSEKFEQGIIYDEKEVNSILNEYHSFNDPATIRRLLFGYGYLDRSKDGRAYWKTNKEQD